jgi:hypothetical protein
MARPQRKAARDALERIQRIQEWEKLSENSQLFIECAAKIDAEMEAEISKKEVMTTDLDIFDEDDENDEKDEEQDDSEDEYDESFVVSDASDDEQKKIDDDYCHTKKKRRKIVSSVSEWSRNSESDSESDSKSDWESGSENVSENENDSKNGSENDSKNELENDSKNELESEDSLRLYTPEYFLNLQVPDSWGPNESADTSVLEYANLSEISILGT